jgi:hypothetical protein
LAAAANATAYQWIDCNTNEAVAGATDQSFTPIQNGSYAVQLFFGNGCSTTTGCYNVTMDGIDQLHQGIVSAYPNPGDGEVRFNLNAMRGVLSVYNALGQTVYVAPAHVAVSVSHLPAGLLTYKFVSDGGAVFSGNVSVQR